MARFGWEEGLSLNKVLRLSYRLMGTLFIGSYLRFVWFRKTLVMHWNDWSSLHCCDMGCGNASYSFYIARLFPNVMIDAIDVDEVSLDRNRKLAQRLEVNNIRFRQGNCLEWNEVDCYDVIYSTCMLIYWDRQTQLDILSRLRISLKPQGMMYLMVPKQGYLNHSLLPVTWYAEAYRKMKNENHGYLYTASEMDSDLTKAGFSKVLVKEVGGFWGRLACDIEYVLQERGWGRLKLLLIPCLKLLCHADRWMCWGRKNWLWVRAWR